MRFHRLLSPILVLLLFFLFFTSSSEVTKPTKLVDSICKKTWNYTFCVNTLYSDARVGNPDADSYLLAYVSFGLAYTNATTTSSQIPVLLKNANTKKDVSLQHALRQCKLYYKKAVSAIEEAYNDLNSETYSYLISLTKVASDSASNCESSFNGTVKPYPLTERNNGLKGLCEICVVVSKLFT
ncbi:Cell wall / vacuolar inhibitor of fructosidase [Thalictrum thalictroides]|uniref:Cell wall / vacuolar inhibitor of fructosidase n=1 Tax=Thalictrum thalictroides TaxID=46969 RepID=A0A7J6WA40_THATH|nr:Cell wall / vacuolar inhibitor of fructosidase [Thalictrum thalictroides]